MINNIIIIDIIFSFEFSAYHKNSIQFIPQTAFTETNCIPIQCLQLRKKIEQDKILYINLSSFMYRNLWCFANYLAKIDNQYIYMYIFILYLIQYIISIFLIYGNYRAENLIE